MRDIKWLIIVENAFSRVNQSDERESCRGMSRAKQTKGKSNCLRVEKSIQTKENTQ